MNKNSTVFYFTAYRKLLRAYTEFQMNAVAEYELSPNEIVVLASLDTVTTASEIASDADVSKALVSRSVKLLKEKEFITTSISEVDKREQKLELTEKGREVAELIDEANHRFLATSFANFEENEFLVLKALLKMMLNNLNIGGLDDNS